jgi:hypothetical protein
MDTQTLAFPSATYVAGGTYTFALNDFNGIVTEIIVLFRTSREGEAAWNPLPVKTLLLRDKIRGPNQGSAVPVPFQFIKNAENVERYPDTLFFQEKNIPLLSFSLDPRDSNNHGSIMGFNHITGSDLELVVTFPGNTELEVPEVSTIEFFQAANENVASAFGASSGFFTIFYGHQATGVIDSGVITIAQLNEELRRAFTGPGSVFEGELTITAVFVPSGTGINLSAPIVLTVTGFSQHHHERRSPSRQGIYFDITTRNLRDAAAVLTKAFAQTTVIGVVAGAERHTNFTGVLDLVMYRATEMHIAPNGDYIVHPCI